MSLRRKRWAARAGDHIVFVRNSKVPFVIREAGRGQYRFVGGRIDTGLCMGRWAFWMLAILFWSSIMICEDVEGKGSGHGWDWD